ncbi:hypothetical protein V6N13_081118 [Hibiscus sabdariffa]
MGLWDAVPIVELGSMYLGRWSQGTMEEQVDEGTDIEYYGVDFNKNIVVHQDRLAVEILLSKGLPRKAHSVNDLVVDYLSAKQCC